jgi:rhamnose transport system ATP-binding protein
MAGLVGAGRSEIARAIFGIDPYDEGTVEVNGQMLPGGSVARAKHVGMAMVPEDRQHEGLVLPMSVQNNLTLANLRDLQDFGWLSQTRERGQAKRLIADLDIRVTDPQLPVETLSGGNQQKVVIGKWLASMPNLLILDEPTRGVDVAAKAQVHRLIRELADEGMATLMISSELSEILTLSDRILVIHQGRIAAEFEGATATQEQLLHAALVGSAS